MLLANLAHPVSPALRADARPRRAGAHQLVQQLPPVRAQGAPRLPEEFAARGEKKNMPDRRFPFFFSTVVFDRHFRSACGGGVPLHPIPSARGFSVDGGNNRR